MGISKIGKRFFIIILLIGTVFFLYGVRDSYAWNLPLWLQFGPKKVKDTNLPTKLKLKVYNDLGGNTPALLKTYFNFIPSARYDDTATSPFPIPPGKGEYNVKNKVAIGVQLTYGNWGQVVGLNGTCWVYKNCIDTWFDDYLDERYARTAAHEMGHRTSSHGGLGDAPDKTCTMYQNTAPLYPGTEHFCTYCETNIFIEIGGR
jgi:hypothetical protein